MRKVNLVIGAATLIALSASITLYIVHHPVRPEDDDQLQVGLSNAPERVLSPSELLSKSPGDASHETTSSAAKSPRRETRRRIVYPLWQPNEASQVSEAQAVTDANDLVAPLWSPLGLDIACTRSDFQGIYLAAPTSAPVRLLSDAPKSGHDFAWNPDGMSLRVREPDGLYAELMITGERYPAAEPPRRVFERDNLIYFQSEDGEIVRISGQEDRFRSPRLSGDASKVVYLGCETGIYIASVDGSQILSVGPGANPSWLPDSSGIVYDLPVHDGLQAIDSDLWYASADGKERTNLTRTPTLAESHPAVAPDGQRIAYCCQGAILVGKFVREVKE